MKEDCNESIIKKRKFNFFIYTRFNKLHKKDLQKERRRNLQIFPPVFFTFYLYFSSFSSLFFKYFLSVEFFLLFELWRLSLPTIFFLFSSSSSAFSFSASSSLSHERFPLERNPPLSESASIINSGYPGWQNREGKLAESRKIKRDR